MIEGGVEAALKAHYAGVRKRLRMDPPPARVLRLAPVEVFASPAPSAPLWEPIMAEVCLKHGVSDLEIMGHTRSHRLLNARQELYYRMRREAGMTLMEIGETLGHRHHTTIIKGLRSHAARMARGEA